MQKRVFRKVSLLFFLVFLSGIAVKPAFTAEPAPGKDFTIGDIGRWKVTSTGPSKLEVSIKEGTLVLRWPGGAGEAIVEHLDKVPIAPLLKDGFVRYKCRLNILDDQYGSELGVQLQPVRNDGKAANPYYMRPAQYGAQAQVRGIEGTKELLYAPPGQWADVDFNYQAPAGVTAVKPRFLLQGNAITVAIKEARVEQGLTWQRGRNPARPEDRAFEEAKVEKILAERKQAIPRLEQHAGRVALVVNGQDVLPACYTRGLFYPQYTRYREFTKAGYNLFRIWANFNPLSATHKAGIGNLWRAKDAFDFSDLERELKVIANINPEAMVIVSMNIMPYHAWADENPDSIVANSKGEKLIVYGGEKIQYGGKPDYTSNREADYAPSFYGGQFPSDAANAVKRLAQFLQTSPAGKIVVGVEFTGGTDGQIYPWDRDESRGEDYSPAGLTAWRDFLRRRYGNDTARLQVAWKRNDATFENASIPSLADRGYGSRSSITPGGVDYNGFLSAAIADFMLGLGKALKEGSDNRLLAGVYYSDSGEQGAIARGALSTIANSPSIDMVRSVMRYQTSGSWWLHKKLTWAELDMRPPMPSPMQYFTSGLQYSPAQFQTRAWRNAVMALTDLRGGFYPYDMAESWYQDQAMIEAFGKVRAGLQSALDDTVNVPPTVGVFSDEELPFQLNNNLGYQLTRTSSYGLLRALDRSGVTYARYILKDAFDPSFTLPRICILRLPLTVTPTQAKTLREKAQRSGSILIWEYAPGALAPGKPDTKSVTGFNAEPVAGLARLQIEVSDAGPLTQGLAGRFLGTPNPPISLDDNSRWNGAPYVVQPEAGDVVLGRYSGTQEAGAVMLTRDGLTQIMLGIPGALSPQFVRNLARQVGVTPFSEADDEMCFGSGILAFYADRGGPRKITLPTGMRVAASMTGHSYKAEANGFNFQIGYGEIAVFKILQVP